ncbi:tRNA pseudouridine synthase B [Klebsiella pneumoniae]|nr:tRNA pseudouridine synthase B [Klebsiella pneumoniae]
MSRPRRRGRDVHGVLLLDKPQGASSNDVLQKVKRIYNANRAGHTGALDPLATGMLPICLGEATKFSQYLLDSDKRYRVIAKTWPAHGYLRCRRSGGGRAPADF